MKITTLETQSISSLYEVSSLWLWVIAKQIELNTVHSKMNPLNSLKIWKLTLTDWWLSLCKSFWICFMEGRSIVSYEELTFQHLILQLFYSCILFPIIRFYQLQTDITPPDLQANWMILSYLNLKIRWYPSPRLIIEN